MNGAFDMSQNNIHHLETSNPRTYIKPRPEKKEHGTTIRLAQISHGQHICAFYVLCGPETMRHC